jgi:hypothetical protein
MSESFFITQPAVNQSPRLMVYGSSGLVGVDTLLMFVAINLSAFGARIKTETRVESTNTTRRDLSIPVGRNFVRAARVWRSADEAIKLGE